MFFGSRRHPRGVQERPIRPWKPPLGRPSFFKGSKRPPRALQVASRAHLAAILAPCLINFEASSMRCCPCFSHVSSLKAPSPRALDPRPKAWRHARERLNQKVFHVARHAATEPNATCSMHGMHGSTLGGLGPSESRFQLLFWGSEASRGAPRGQLEAKISDRNKEP